MARIQLYESGVARPVRTPVLRPMPEGNPLGALADALGVGARVADDVAMKFQQEEDNRIEQGLQLKAIQDFDAFGRTLEGREDYQNFQGDFEAFSSKWQEDNLAGVNDRVRNSFAPFMTNMQGRGLVGTRDAARKTQIGVSLADLDSRIADAQTAYTFAETDDARQLTIGVTKEMLEQRVADGVLTRGEAAEMWRKIQQGFADTDVARMERDNPSGLLKDLADPNKLPWIVGAERERIKTRVLADMEAKANAARAEARSRVAALLPDEAAARQDGKFGTILTNKEIIAAYGADDGIKVIGRMQSDADYAQTRRAVANMTPAQEAEALARHVPEGEEYAHERDQHNDLVKAIWEKRQAVQKEPATYVVTNNETVRDLLIKAEQQGAKPEDYRRAIDASLKAQADLGVTVLDRQPLPDAFVADKVALYESKGNDQQKFDVLMHYVGTVQDPLVRRQVMGQFVKAGVSPEAGHAVELGLRGARNQAVQVLREGSIKELPELPDGIEKGDVARGIDATYGSSDGIGSAIAYQWDLTGDPGYLDLLNADRKLMQKMVTSRVASGNKDTASSAESANAQAFGLWKPLGDSEIGQVVVTAGTDADKFELGLWGERRRIGESVAAAAQPFIPRNEQEVEQITRWRQDYADRLQWINVGDDLGERFALVDPAANGRVVTDASGAKIIVTRDAILKAEGGETLRREFERQNRVLPNPMGVIVPPRREPTP